MNELDPQENQRRKAVEACQVIAVACLVFFIGFALTVCGVIAWLLVKSI
jgi:hypothetical protein